MYYGHIKVKYCVKEIQIPKMYCVRFKGESELYVDVLTAGNNQ
jgi:hypothetical protein